MKQEVRDPLLAHVQEYPSDHSQYDPVPSILIRYLYIGHFLARWGTRFSFLFSIYCTNFQFFFFLEFSLQLYIGLSFSYSHTY